MKIYCSNCGKNKSFMSTKANIKRIINIGWGSYGGALYCPKCVSTWGERNTSELSNDENTFRLISEIHENNKKSQI